MRTRGVQLRGGPPVPHYSGGVKEFVVYTGLRILLFLAALGVVLVASGIVTIQKGDPTVWPIADSPDAQ